MTHPSPESLDDIRSLRRSGNPRLALTRLEALEVREPRSGRLWEERAECLRALGERGPAIAAYRRAVELNDALPACWSALRDSYLADGMEVEARAADRCLVRLGQLPPEVAQASSELNEGDLDGAEGRIRAFLQSHGPQIEGMRLLAQIGVKREVYDDAELLLEHVLRMAPDYHDARYEFAAVLLHRRRYWLAANEAGRLLQVEPENRLYRTLCAQALDGLGRFDEALAGYRALAAEYPDDATFTVAIGHILKTQGAAAEAMTAFRTATRPGSGQCAAAYHALANMKTVRFSGDDIARMRALESDPQTSIPDRYRLCFALGKALEDSRQFPESFEYYARGNALKRAEQRYRPEIMERNMALQAEVCTREFFAKRRGFGCKHRDPIFVLGLPRSGSTLIEQILASHSQVDGTLELPDIPRLVQHFRDRRADAGIPRYPGILADLSAADFESMGLDYLEATAVFRQGAPRFVDKMPANFRDIGFIHLILPNAKIIDARREPMACCFGNFKQLFSNGQEFSYSLEDLGRYYRAYIRLMTHWEQALPGKVLTVQHEAVVSDLEGSVRRMLDFCGLDFEPECLEFHRAKRSVRTVSSEQVRRPIYRDGIDQWRNFEPWLGPLKAALFSESA